MNAGLNTHWEPQPAGAEWVSRVVEEYSSRNPVLRDFSGLLATHTGTRLTDWIDHLEVCTADGLLNAGFTLAADGWYEHSGALLPPVRVSGQRSLVLRVDSVSDFAVTCSHRFPIEVTGSAGDLLRTAWIARSPDTEVHFGVIERIGCSIRRAAPARNAAEKQQLQELRERLRLRQRVSHPRRRLSVTLATAHQCHRLRRTRHRL